MNRDQAKSLLEECVEDARAALGWGEELLLSTAASAAVATLAASLMSARLHPAHYVHVPKANK